MIMVYTTEPFRISTIVTYLHFLLVKVIRGKYSSWAFCAFVGILNKPSWVLGIAKSMKNSISTLKTRIRKRHEMFMLTASSRVHSLEGFCKGQNISARKNIYIFPL